MRLIPHSFRADGFTFVEVFAAMLFLAILVPAIVEALKISGRASALAQRGTVAAELAENKLNDLIVEQTWQQGSNTSGDFGTDYPGYKWQMTQQTWSQDTTNTMYELDMQVTYQVQGMDKTYLLSTLISGSATGTGSTTGAGSTTGGMQ